MRGQRRVRAAYNSGRDANTMLLERLIPQYDKGSQVNMIQECSRFLHKAQALDLARASDDKAASTIVPWTVRGAHHEPSFYTIEFSSPVVQYIPPVFASLHLRRWYSRQLDVEYIPSYLVNLNRVVLSKSYLKRPSPNTQDTVGDGLFSRLDFVGGMRATLSSTNLLLPGGAKPQVQRSLQDAIRMCFEHCWWLPPAPGGWTDASFANNMAYHSSKRVTGIVKLHKTLVRIIGKSGSETIRIVPGGKAVRCVNADVALLVDDGKDLLSERRRMLMTEGAASSVAEGTVMNAVIAVQDIGNPKTSLIMGHATGAMRPGCVQPAVSLSIWQILRGLRIDSGLTFVGETSVITEHVSRMLDNNTAESGVFYPDYIWRFTRNDAERQIDDLFPLYVREGSSIYQMPPAVISFLAASGPDVLPQAARSIPQLLNLVSPDAGKWGGKAQSALEAHMAGGATSWLARLLSSIPIIAAQAGLTRIFSERVVAPPKG